MKVLHLLKHHQPGNGHVHVAVDLACAQVAAGDVVAFAAGPGFYRAVLREHGVEVHELQHSGKRPLVVLAALVRLVRLIRSFEPDVVHAHMMSSAVLAYVASKITGVPMVTTVHNSFDRHSVIMRLGAVVVAVSDAEHRLLLSRGYSRQTTVTVMNGPVGSPRERPDNGSIVLEQPCIVTLSGLHPRKAVGDVIEAFSYIRERFPAWHLNLIGDGPQRAELQRYIEHSGLSDRVHLVGSTRNPMPLLRSAEVFVSASIAEPFGLSVAEARAAGCAVVATDVGGIPEVLDFGRAGHLVPVNNPQRLAAALGLLLEKTDTLGMWQDRARRGSERFSVDRMAADYRDVYARVIENEFGGCGC